MNAVSAVFQPCKGWKAAQRKYVKSWINLCTLNARMFLQNSTNLFLVYFDIFMFKVKNLHTNERSIEFVCNHTRTIIEIILRNNLV